MADRSFGSKWWVLAIAIVTGGLSAPGQSASVSVFVDRFVTDLSLSRSSVAAAYLIGTLLGALALPAVGSRIDSRGVRPVMVLIGLSFGLALVGMSAVNGLLSLAIGFAGIRLLGQGALSLASTVAVQRSFDDLRGTALGIHTTAVSALIALAPLGLALSIGAIGWRWTWMASAIVVVSIVPACAVFGLRHLDDPENLPERPQVSMRVSRSPLCDAGGRAHVELATSRSLSRSEAVRRLPFWSLAFMAATAGAAATALTFHQIDLLGRVGMEETAAAAMFAPQVIGSTLAALAIGRAADRFGVRYLPAVVMVLLVVALLAGAVVRPGLAAFAYAVMVGSTIGAQHAVTVSIIPVWFGLAHVGSILGAITLCAVIGSAIGPLALTLTLDAVGSYETALVLWTAAPIAVLFLALRARQR